MNTDGIKPHEHDSSKAERILEIDEEIAALERIKLKSRTPLLAAFALISLLVFFFLFVSSDPNYADYRYLLVSILLVAVPAAVLALQQAKNRKHVLELEQELDGLIAEPSRPGLKPGSGD